MVFMSSQSTDFIFSTLRLDLESLKEIEKCIPLMSLTQQTVVTEAKQTKQQVYEENKQ